MRPRLTTTTIKMTSVCTPDMQLGLWTRCDDLSPWPAVRSGQGATLPKLGLGLSPAPLRVGAIFKGLL